MLSQRGSVPKKQLVGKPRNTIPKKKFSPENFLFYRYSFEWNWTKSFFEQPENQMNKEILLKFLRRYKNQAFSRSMTVAVNYRRGIERLIIKALRLMRNLASHPIYDGVYQEKLRNFFPSNLVGAMMPSLGFLFEQPDNVLEVFTKANETCFLTLFGNK